MAALGFTLLFTACAAPARPQSTPTQPATPTVPPTATPTITATVSPSPTPTITPTPTPAITILSPLEGIPLEEMPEINANPFHPPAPGKDDPHHGIDFSYWRYKDKVGMLGLPVYSALPGRIAMSDSGHFPFGNAVIIETPLINFPSGWVTALDLPAVEPLWEMDNRLNCPKPTQEPTWDSTARSLYLLYAHLENPSELKLGAEIRAGDPIGQVGHSGNAINDHLHLEVRVGPSDASFASMEHYSNGATDEQMWNYCTWRVSGHFKMIDPLKLLSLKP